ncbi:type II secretion system F family protein [Uliginosibacterium sediminicola]|uniref:Type II secretion system F family protein n=1 Tax=Uliginosibacterium sediminicola TaxID=2024550 RepID=A0ABU9Z0C1_9RHOO
MQFEVRALTADNQLQTLTLEADDEFAARKACEARRLRPVTLRVRSGSGKRRGRGSFSLVLFSQELLSLLEAGLSLVESLEALVEKESGLTARGVMESLIHRMREGMKFSDAVGLQPEHFPPLYIGIVRAAERTSDLPRALARFIDYQTRMELVRGRLVSAAIYPAILLTVGSSVAMFLMMYVVPKFAAVYKDSGRELPLMSRLLLGWGDFIGAHLMIVLPALLALVVLVVVQIQRINREGRWAQIAARIPGVAERAQILEISRLYLTIGMLLEGGIPIVTALDMVAGTVSATSRAKLAAARAAISNGEPVSQAFEAHGLTTPIALRMLRVGERSGQMGAMLTRSALFYEGESSRWLERFSKVVEPVMMAIIGLVVGLIVVLLYMPIFDLAGSIQ